MKRILFYIIGILLMSTRASAQENPFVGHPELKDSLQLAALNHAHDSTLLQILDALFVIDVQQPNVYKRGHALYAEANRQDNDHYRLQAARYLSALYYNDGRLDSSYVWSKRQESLSYKLKHWSYYMKALNNIADIHISNKRYEFAYQECLKVRQKAIELNEPDGRALADLGLLNIYNETGREQEEEQLLKEIMEYLPQVNNFYTNGNVYIHFLRIYQSRKQYDKMAEGLKIFQDFLDKSCRKKPDFAPIFRDYYVILESYYIHYFLLQNNPEEAHRHVELGKSYIIPSTYRAFIGAYEAATAFYYYKINQYSQSLAHMDSALQCYDSRTAQATYQKECRNKADILFKQGKLDESLAIYEHALAYADNQLKETADMQRDEFRQLYHINELEMDRNQLNHRIMLILLGVSILFIFLLTLYMFRLQRIRRRLKYSDREIEQNLHIAEQADKDKEAFLANISYLVRLPLNSVVGFSQILCTEPDLDIESRKEISRNLQKDSNRLLDLINDILELSRLEAQKTKWMMQDTDLIHACRTAIAKSAQRNREMPEVLFTSDLESCIVKADVERITQLFGSLLRYPKECTGTSQLPPKIHITQIEKSLRFTFINPPIVQADEVTEETNIRHMVNRLLVEYFGGSYKQSVHEDGSRVIYFDYPLE